MQQRPRSWRSLAMLACAQLTALVLAAGCAPSPARDDAATRERPGGSIAATASSNAPVPAGGAVSGEGYPETVSFSNGPPPKLTHRDFTLPAGCEVTDHTGALAAYSQNTFKADPPWVLGIIDLSSGRHRIVLERPVMAENGYCAFTPRLSQSWFVWEEVSPNEGAQPREAHWLLYAAPLDTKQLSIGAPRLVDEGYTDRKPRPSYAVLGSTVFWTANLAQSPKQEYVHQSGSVNGLDLEAGTRRTVLESPRGFSTLVASNGRIVVTEPVRDLKPSASADGSRVHVLDASGAPASAIYDLKNIGPLSHFVQTSGSAAKEIAWAVFATRGAEWPDLYVRDSSGRVLLAGMNAIDPVFFGDSLAFESVDTSRGVSGMLERSRRIRVADISRRTRSVLLDTGEGHPDDEADLSHAGWWQTCAASTASDTLLIWNDLGPWIEDQSRAKTIVRLYRVP